MLNQKLIYTKQYNILITDNFPIFENILVDYHTSKKLIVVDENTKKHCFPLLKNYLRDDNYIVHQIKSGEKNKNLATVEKIWLKLIKHNFTRNDIVINLGGGVICDLGGFAASCFKRGIKFLHAPTTLLAMVDASVGGKTGVNFDGYKNMIGMFNDPDFIYINPKFLETLPERQMKSGFAEMLKHVFISDKKYWKTFKHLSEKDVTINLIAESIEFKYKIVKKDWKESGMRKLLNFGHTVGHALESYSLKNDKKPLLHGEAIAMGMIIEAKLSQIVFNLKEEEFTEIKNVILKHFNYYNIDNFELKEMKKIMMQDKKNIFDGELVFTMLRNFADPIFDMNCEPEELKAAIKYYKHDLKKEIEQA